MRRSELTGADGGWAGLELEVSDRPRPGLCPYVAEGGRLLLRRGDGAPVLLARVEDGDQGVDFLRTGGFRSPLPPLRADEARRVPGSAGWAHRFAEALNRSPDSPVHDGRWALWDASPFQRWKPASMDSAEYWRELLVEGDPDGYVDWFVHNGSWEVLPLRAWPEASDARVKAYRRQVREGVLPPVLLWWCSGLDTHVVLDGHARLAAALAEDTAPPLLELVRLAPADDVAADTAAAVAAYERELDRFATLRVTRGTHVPDGAALAGPVLARDLGRARTGHRPSWAWPLPGRVAEWQRVARESDAGWADRVT
ncbi:hypothetical protein V2W30_35360 [Streptomyces sp. Q6]|uniref:Uncharacterized protein n=1 Tax=Streptomyces citrinus TaxID=3118173 RepID=A0ACD5ALI0_9ACTN